MLNLVFGSIIPTVKHYPGYEWFLTPHWLRRFGPLKLVRGSLLDRVGLHFFTLYASMNGLMQGFLTLAIVVFRKTLHADELMIGVITAMGNISLLVGIFGSEYVEGRDKRPFIFWLGIINRATLLLFFFCDSVWFFLVVMGVFYIGNALLMPSVLSLWQANVSADARNRLWGATVVVSTILSMVAAFAFGKILDIDENSFRWIFPIGGLFAMIGVVILALSPLRGQYKLDPNPPARTFNKVVIQPVTSFINLLKTDRKFFRFEAVFFLYGLALMVLMPVVPTYIVDIAQMSYIEAGIATGITAQFGVIFLTPVWGQLMDRTGPQYLCFVIFGILTAVPAMLFLGLYSPAIGIPANIAVYAAHIMLGIGMSGIHVAWSLGPVAFAGKRDSSGYSGAHVTLTGIRGLVGPLAGAIGLKYLGYQPVFALSFILFSVASIGMFILVKRHGLMNPKLVS